MNRTNRILPTYTGDVSGACSALFELGGMVVIHDPSGCNSTYNTHDETRWYDHDSLIFITGLIERDAILGNDQKLVDDVVDAALELHPRFIALCNSPIPFISGTDFSAICKIIERRCGIPCLYVRTNGMHDYVTGASNAFVALAKRFVADAPQKSGACNILGVTPLDLGIATSDTALRTFVQDAGFTVTSCWAMGSTLDELVRAAEAEVNLVVSSTGLALAQYLYERFGTPFVVGFPTGAIASALATALRTAAQTKDCAWPCRDMRSAQQDGTRFVIGEPVLMGSIAAAAELAGSAPLRLVCPLESPEEILGASDIATFGEEEVERSIAESTLVIADELYAPVVPPTARLTPIAHQAFSGRYGWPTACDLANGHWG